MSPNTLLFIHPPRTATATFASILAQQYGVERVRAIGERSDHGLLAMEQAARDSLACVLGRFSFGMHHHFTGPCSYATMLRDPVDAVISLYFSIKNRQNHPWHGALVAHGLTLRAFAEGDECGHTDNYQLRLLLGRRPGEVVGRPELELAKNLLCEGFAAFGLVERFDESLLLFRRRFGWKAPYYIKQSCFPHPEDLRTVTLEDRLLIACRHALDRQLVAFARNLLVERIRDAGDGFARELAAFRRVNYGYDQLDRLGLRLKQTRGRLERPQRYPWMKAGE